MLQALASSLDIDGLTARVHGLSKRKPPNSLSYTDIEGIVHYANGNAWPLPGRLPNVKKSIVLLLPTDKSMADIHQIYLQSAAEMCYRCISLWTFQRYWAELHVCPQNTIANPATFVQTYASRANNLPKNLILVVGLL